MKITNIVLCILFLLFAAVQFNDPDPWIWVALYTLVAAVCGMAAVGNYRKTLILLGLAVCGIELFNIGPEFLKWIDMGMPNIVDEMKTEAPHIEFAREFLGLLFCVLVLAWQYYIVSFRLKKEE
ncbi:MAG: hypothetical protein ACI9XO_000513 [Paraglaciecola sp.]|jgi:hypothetical protein